MPLVSLRAYARHRDCTLGAVQKAIKAGRIEKTSEGKIDSDVADAKWAANTDPGRRNTSTKTVARTRVTNLSNADSGKNRRLWLNPEEGERVEKIPRAVANSDESPFVRHRT